MCKICALIGLIICLIAIPTYGEETSISIPNSGFETLDNQTPSNWFHVIKEDLTQYKYSADTTQFQSGAASLKLSHSQPVQSKVISDYVSLQVGQLYRLSGWIRAREAVTDPIHRYPTPVAGCLSMESFPFTNHSPAVGGTSEWERVEALFIATRSKDRVVLHLGNNGPAKGTVWFDDIKLEKVEDITAYIPMETVKWFGPAYRYTDRGWIFVHIEGEPYQRGYQYGYLLSQEIVSYLKKLAYEEDHDNPARGWKHMRELADSLMLRKYEPEYLREMKGIADGAKKAGATFDGSPLDLIDIVAVNSSIDIGQMRSALKRTGHALTGESFLETEDELNIPLKQHKCSAMLANGPATPNGDIVFFQIFMWGGYTGVHWNVICDVKPAKGNRLVYQTYPGGIHSGADFYLNGSGIMMGETTVSQTPFDMNGSPQSNRIRKAAQYANSIDDAVKILKYKNNGMYTNDWLIGDSKTNETAIFLLGTQKTKLWRSGKKQFPGNTPGFLWSNNNNKDPEVRKEYIPSRDNRPYDLVFRPWNRDLAFNEFFKETNGNIDELNTIRLMASSPINRSHACDGKVTTTEMARNMVFWAHHGKVTLREKFPGGRILRDYPGAFPHLSLGYTAFSPVYVTEKLQALKARQDAEKAHKTAKADLSNIEEMLSFDKIHLWHNTVFPATSKENWFVSGTASYWGILDKLPSKAAKASTHLHSQLAQLNTRLIYTESREGTVAPIDATRKYDQYKHYMIPRIRGTFLLHQLRLALGNQTFGSLMKGIHDSYRNKPLTTGKFLNRLGKISKKDMKGFVSQWLERDNLPDPVVGSTSVKVSEDSYRVTLTVKQSGTPYHFFTTVAIETASKTIWKMIEVKDGDNVFEFDIQEEPMALTFNAGNDIPVNMKNYYTLGNFFDDFHNTTIVYGTNRQIEANHTMALQLQTVLADTYSEILPEIKKDSEITREELSRRDLFVLGDIADNRFLAGIAHDLEIDLGRNYFRWQGKTYGDEDDGLIVVYPNPYNREKVVYLIIANSSLQLYQMTRKYRRLPSWALCKGEKIVNKGYHPVGRYHITFSR
jgi:hypothetical protein